MGKQKACPDYGTAACERLGNAIILRAAKDYRVALRALAKNANNITANRYKDDVERFFRSGWFTALTAVDGEMLIRRLQEEAAA